MNYFEYTSKICLAESQETVVFSSVKAIVINGSKIRIYSKKKINTVELLASEDVQKKLLDDFTDYLRRKSISYHSSSYAYLKTVVVLNGLARISSSDYRLVLDYQDRDFPVFIETSTFGILGEIRGKILERL